MNDSARFGEYAEGATARLLQRQEVASQLLKEISERGLQVLDRIASDGALTQREAQEVLQHATTSALDGVTDVARVVAAISERSLERWRFYIGHANALVAQGVDATQRLSSINAAGARSALGLWLGADHVEPAAREWSAFLDRSMDVWRRWTAPPVDAAVVTAVPAENGARAPEAPPLDRIGI